jgi:hypothetical protein
MKDDKIPTALDVLNALLLVTETNLEQAEKNFVEAHALWESHRDQSGSLVSFHTRLPDLLDDLTKISAITERTHMLKYFIKILNEAKEMCQVE